MKRLRGRKTGEFRDETGSFECDELVLDIDHGRSVTIRREGVGGEDGIALFAGIDRNNRMANARFVIRAKNFGYLHVAVEQAQ
jgi:hypothetical protein